MEQSLKTDTEFQLVAAGQVKKERSQHFKHLFESETETDRR